MVFHPDSIIGKQSREMHERHEKNKDYSGSHEENKKLHGKETADKIGDARLKMYARHAATKEHELPNWGKGK